MVEKQRPLASKDIGGHMKPDMILAASLALISCGIVFVWLMS